MRPVPDHDQPYFSDAAVSNSIPQMDVPVGRGNAYTSRSEPSTDEVPAVIRPASSAIGRQVFDKLVSVSDEHNVVPSPSNTDDQPARPEGVPQDAASSAQPSTENEPSGASDMPTGGNANKPPTEPPDAPSTPEPGEPDEPPRPVEERYRQELRGLVHRAQEVVDHRTDRSVRVHTTGTVVNSVYNLTAVDAPLRSKEALPSDIKDVQELANASIGELEGAAQNHGEAAGSRTADYYVENKAAYGINGAYVGVHTVSRLIDNQPGEELLTLTSVAVPSAGTEELVHSWIQTQGEHVLSAQMLAIPAVDVPDFVKCRKMFGDRGALNDVLHGVYENDLDALVKLGPVVEAADMRAEYTKAEIDHAVSQALRIGVAVRADRLVDNGIRPDRLARVQQHLDTYPY